MDFIDYVTLMLINMAAGLGILAGFLWKDIAGPNRQRWAPAFGAPGLVATVCGFAMIFSWPLPNPYNIAYGEMSILLGVLFLGAAWGLARQWDLMPLGWYAVPAGAVAVLTGIRFLNLGLTNSPALSATGFILTGAAGVFAPMVLLKPSERFTRRIGTFVLLAAAGIWAFIACMAYWAHLKPAG